MEVTGLDGKVALITGSSKGIGRATAITLAEAGADVVINHRDSAAEAETAREAVESAGRRAIVVQADVGIPDDVERMFDTALAEFGKIDIGIHNATYSRRELAVELPFKDWKRALEVGLDGGFIVAQRTARDLIRRGKPGSIVFVGSIQAVRNPARSSAYNTAKNGLRGLTYTLAIELAEHQIRVNLLEPGWIDTPGERKYATEEKLAEGGRRMPWGRMGRPEEMANAILFLVSDLGSYVSGETLRADAATWLLGGEDI